MKYRLIQTYPGYETLGTIHCSENKTPEWLGTNFYDAHPKYWQKVEEVDYKILSFIRIDSTCVPKDSIGILFELQEDGLFGTYNKYSFHSEKQMLESKYSVKTGFFAIHSVKRLSDGEVFTIDYFTSFGQIRKFTICNNKEMIAEFNGNLGFSNIKFLNKLPKKTPLFTTEDGVEIFEGDKFYYPNIHIWKTIISEADKRILIFIRLNKYKPFSTKEKSEEYILLNKPCLSIKEITDLVLNNPNKRISDCAEIAIINSLNQLAKSKL